MQRMRIVFLCCLLSALCWGKAVAFEFVDIYGFMLQYGNTGDNPTKDRAGFDHFDSDTSTRDFKPDEKQQIGAAIGYWAERLKNMTPLTMPVIYVGYNGTDPPQDGASAASANPADYYQDPSALTISPNGMIHDKYISKGAGYGLGFPSGVADNIIIFSAPFASEPTRLLLGDWSVMSTMLHETAHALGMYATLTGVPGKEVFDANLNAWGSSLHDIRGIRAMPGSQLRLVNSPGDDDDTEFRIYGDNLAKLEDYTYPVFRGPNVDALTDGKGMPVMGYMTGGGYLSHPGIMNSIMSYGIIRNMAFTEMELAAFKDMGYDIDLSQSFGKSYYYDVGGDTQINTAPFGTAANPNTSTFGVGAHILRDNLTLTQATDIYAHGYGAGGIRIDGVGNTVTIPGGVTVSAKGDFGTGLLVSYGSNNAITLGGSVQATGPGGIGAHFGIGAATTDIRSYYMSNPPPTANVQEKYECWKAEQDLAGPLVKSFDIYGSLSGGLAAIRIENDSHVEAINLHGGAQVAGDIVSYWARNTPGKPGKEYATAINFGQAGSGGTMRVDGNILWQASKTHTEGALPENSLDIAQLGGYLSYNGIANVHTWEVNRGASLGGNSSITIDGPAPFLNAGLISPGNKGIGAITVNGGYQQGASGGLFMEFTPTAADQFIVNKGGASISIDPGASLSLQPLPAFYATGSQRALTNQVLFNDTLDKADFNQTLLPLASPTLSSWWSRSGATPVFNVTRMPNAYSKYASGATGASVGKALVGVGARATGDMQTLFTALDFSRPDGATVRSGLRQLAPTAYDNAAKASLHTGRALSGLLLEQMSAVDAPGSASAVKGLSAGSEEAANSAFVQPVGGYYGQNAKGDNQGFDASFAGIMGGVSRRFEKGSAGLHGAVIHSETGTRSEAAVRSLANGVRFGVHGSLYPYEGFFLNALASVGLENTRMTRNVEIDAYKRTNNASYTAFMAQGALRAGYARQVGNICFGPLAGLEYGFYHRPPVAETNGQATRLKLYADNSHSLRSALGGQVKMHTRLTDNLALQAGLSVQWMHELLNTSCGSTAFFTGYSGDNFSASHRADDRDALALNASVTLVSGGNLSLNAYAGTELFRQGSSSIQGGLSVGWKF